MDNVSISTPLGQLTAKVSPDTDNLGLWISLNGDDCVLISNDKDEKHLTVRVWKKDCSCDPVAKVEIKECSHCGKREDG